MAAENLASISNALSQLFAPKLEKQWNRTTQVSNLVTIEAGSGKNAAWATEFTGATASTVAEGSDVLDAELASDVNVPATQAWAHYRTSFKISETELDAAASSMGSAQALMSLFEDRIVGNGAVLASLIENDLINGTGVDGSSNPTLVGLLGGALAATGTYAGINRSTYSEWAGNVFANGGTARALSVDLLLQAEQAIKTRSGSNWDYILASPGCYRKYEGLFAPVQRQAIDGRGPLAYGVGASELFFKGKPVIWTRLLPAGTMIMMSSEKVSVKYLPRVLSPNDAVMAQMVANAGGNGDEVKTVSSLPVRIAVLAKNGDSIKVSMKTSIAACAKRPSAFAVIQDILET